MIQSIAFTVYPVSDISAARNFYENVLGLKLSRNFNDQWIEYDVGDGTFALTTMQMGHTPGAKGAVVAFEVDNLDLTVAELKAKSVPVVLEPMPTPVCRMAVIADPDGNHVTLHRRNAVDSA
ncbi:MAG TPA: VOC family protein [Opitutus sp.]|nr:VOC family protein [Opitutus sp.]